MCNSSLKIFLCLGLLAFTTIGCEDALPGTPANLESRLAAAEQVSDPALSASTLASVATDAAKAGNVEVTCTAVDDIRDAALRDETARKCALELSRNSHRDSAVALAQTIGNTAMRDELLHKLAAPLPP